MGNQSRPMMNQQQQNSYSGGQQQQQNGYSGGGQSRPMAPQQNQQQRPGMNVTSGQHYNNNRPMPSPPPQQQNFRPGPPAGSYNNARPQPSPTLSPSMSNNGRRPQNGQPSPGGLQQPPGRFNSPSPSLTHLQANNNSSSFEDLSSPPHSVSRILLFFLPKLKASRLIFFFSVAKSIQRRK
jgi:hypothetical protein